MVIDKDCFNCINYDTEKCLECSLGFDSKSGEYVPDKWESDGDFDDGR